MTLALYGKSRKRQGSLLLAALLAIIAASVGGLAIIGSAFAHHLVIDTQLPTCQNNQSWYLKVTEGGWSGYREAVLTITDNTTPSSRRSSTTARARTLSMRAVPVRCIPPGRSTSTSATSRR